MFFLFFFFFFFFFVVVVFCFVFCFVFVVVFFFFFVIYRYSSVDSIYSVEYTLARYNSLFFSVMVYKILQLDYFSMDPGF